MLGRESTAPAYTEAARGPAGPPPWDHGTPACSLLWPWSWTFWNILPKSAPPCGEHSGSEPVGGSRVSAQRRTRSGQSSPSAPPTAGETLFLVSRTLSLF